MRYETDSECAGRRAQRTVAQGGGGEAGQEKLVALETLLARRER